HDAFTKARNDRDHAVGRKQQALEGTSRGDELGTGPFLHFAGVRTEGGTSPQQCVQKKIARHGAAARRALHQTPSWPARRVPSARYRAYRTRQRCMRMMLSIGITLWFMWFMIQSEPSTSSRTIKSPKASAIRLLMLSGPEVMCRKNTTCTPICATASTD